MSKNMGGGIFIDEFSYDSSCLRPFWDLKRLLSSSTRRVEVREDYKKVFEAVKREKKRTILRNIFQEKTKCSTWEEAENLYEPYVSIVDDYIGKDELN